MNKKLILLVIAIAIFFSFNSFAAHAQTVGNCTNYAYYNLSNAAGNRSWIITNSTLCLRVEILNVSNITIRNGGTLHLQEVNVSFNGSVDPVNFTVESGGTLKIDNGSRIFSANGSSLGFNFYFRPGSSGWINNSSVYNLNNHTGSNGININITDFVLTNVTINNSLGYALNISGGSPTIKNSTLISNAGGILVYNASPTITNITIRLNAESLRNDTGLNITNSNNGSITNITIINQTIGVAFINSNLSIYNITIENTTYAVFAKSSSIAKLVDSFISNPRIGTGTGGLPLASMVYFNVSSNNSNVTFINVQWTNSNISFDGNNTGNFSEQWYVDINVTSRGNSTLVQGATVVINNTTTSSSTSSPTTISMTFTTNTSGTFPRLNLTSFISYYNFTTGTRMIQNYSNYHFNASKGNSSGFNLSINVTNNLIKGNGEINLTLNLSTLTINARGSGAASGYNAQNALLSLINGSSNFTVNSSGAGVGTIDVPFGVYTINTSSGNYTQITNTTYTVNVSEGGNTSYALNVSLLPRINLSGNYNSKFWSDTDQSVNTSTTLTLSGTATYAHNGTVLGGCSQCGNASFYMSSATSYLHSTSYSNVSLSGAFSKSVTPSESGASNRTFTIWLLDSHGDNGTYNDWLYVDIPTAANASSSSSSAASGGGGGGAAADYSLLITEYDRKLTLSQGETKAVKVVVKNTGLKSLNSVGIIIASFEKEWYTTNVSTGDSTITLKAGDAATFDVKFTIPSSAEAKSYNSIWRAKDKDALAIAEKAVNISITQVWTAETIASLNNSITDVQNFYKAVEKNLTSLKDSLKNYTQLESSLKSINETINKAAAAYSTGDYSEAKKNIEAATIELNDLVAKIKAQGVSKGAAAAFAETLKSPQGLALFIGVIAVATVGGFFIWWQFFRVISIAEVKRNPAKFAAGIRIEGVVKEITDTQKGKVFLITDPAGEKLHVRYPYYTTAESGDVIRVSGVVKVYNNIPYMDATELARVSLKPKG